MGRNKVACGGFADRETVVLVTAPAIFALLFAGCGSSAGSGFGNGSEKDSGNYSENGSGNRSGTRSSGDNTARDGAIGENDSGISGLGGTQPGTGESGDSDRSADGGSTCPPVSTSGDPCTAPLAPGSDRKCTFQFGGQSREFLLYAPANYNPCSPVALIVDAHGLTETDVQQAGLQPFQNWPSGLGSSWRLVADREGFIVAQPQGIGNMWSNSDADLMLQIAKMVESVAKVDPKRVYMTGISNGGALTYWTGCKDTPTFTAFAPVSGYGVSSCPLTHPAPIIAFHSKDDKIVSYASGQSAFQAWVMGNHCKHGPTESFQFGGPNTDPREVCLRSGANDTPPWSLAPCDTAAPATTCQTWDQCDQGVAATFCTVPPSMQYNYSTTGGHVLYINGTNLSLAAVAWEYFKQF